MTIKPLALILGLILALVLPVSGAGAAERAAFTIAYLMRADDPYYAPRRAYTGLVLRERKRPLDGARAGLKESRILGRRLGLDFQLLEVELRDGESPDAALAALGESRVVILDVPAADMATAVAALSGGERLLVDVRHAETALRAALCHQDLFFTLPSRAMVNDALAQYLREQNWRRVLMLTGPADEDAAEAAAFEASAAKFGLEIVAERAFLLSNDPRHRERSNVRLLTGEPDHDVVFLADAEGEFGRYVPYATYLPRPVVGSEGLAASGWHWTWERHGAPQLNQRFEKLAGRHMAAADWAAWAVVKAVVEALSRTGATDAKSLKAYLLGEDFTLDSYKGAPGSFRPWDHQLRQPILLHTQNAVIERAPLPAFLHETNHLDTLGPDRSDSGCRLDAAN
jgi:ABC transporter substrate binding protein (PQQ-dependent alcohol dehydrogenase system)